MILVIIMVVAWLVILGPSIVKRRSREGGVNSISHFHRQLRVLEHSAPQPLVAPAHRLRSLDGSGPLGTGPHPVGGGPTPVLTVVGAAELPRPALAFLGDDRSGGSAPHGSDGRAAYAPARPEFGRPADSRSDGPGRSGESPARQLTRRRRRDTLIVLTLVLVSTAVIGFIPGAGVARIVTAVSAVALAAYVCLLVSLRKRADERDQKLRYLSPTPARAERPRERAGTPHYRSGRYAHPSYQAAAAH